MKGRLATASIFCARARRMATLETCQREPRVVGIFRSFSDRVTAANYNGGLRREVCGAGQQAWGVLIAG